MYLLLAILGFLFVGAVAFGLYYHFASNKDNFAEWENMELTKGKRILWLCNLLVMFAGIWLFVWGLIESDSYGAIGGLAWMFTALAAAQFCSPLKPVAMPEGDEKTGCLYFLASPFMLIATVVSGMLSMLIAWFFNLITIFRKSSVAFKIIASLLIAAVVITPPAVVIGIDIAEEKRAEAESEAETTLLENMIAKSNAIIDSGKVEKLELTEEERAYCESNGVTSPFGLKEIDEMVAYKMCDFYKNKDFDGMLRVTEIYNANGYGFSGYYTDDFLDFMINYIKENGQPEASATSYVKCYSYGEYSLIISDDAIMVKTSDGDPGDGFFRYDVNEKFYSDEWLVGETVEIISKNK